MKKGWSLAILLGIAAVPLLAQSPAGASKEPKLPPILPREEEIALALSAGPAHFADEAGVYVLERQGYVKVRESKNGFTCIVSRSQVNTVEPECFDEEGTETLLPRSLMMGNLRAQGKTDEEIEQAVAEAFRTGKLRAPRRPGIVYMLSTKNIVPIDPSKGTVGPYRPHLMFYAPYLTNKDLGTKFGPDTKAFIISEGTPHALIIVPVPMPAGERKP